MKVTPFYALGGAALGYAAVALLTRNWKNPKALYAAGAVGIIGLTIGVYFDKPKTADEVIKADEKVEADTKAKEAAATTGKIHLGLKTPVTGNTGIAGGILSQVSPEMKAQMLKNMQK